MFSTHSFIFSVVSDEPVFNDWGEEIFPKEDIIVDGCLYSPISSDDLQYPDVNRDSTIMRIDLPKTFSRSLSNSTVFFADTNTSLDGREFKVIGDSGNYMAENTPGNWNRYVTCEEILENTNGV